MTTINTLYTFFTNIFREGHSWPTMNFTEMCGEETIEYLNGYIRLHHY